MGFIELVLTVCSLMNPGGCEEKRLPLIDQGGSLMQCMMKAPPYMAAWSEEHPGQRIAKWRCAYPSQEDQDL